MESEKYLNIYLIEPNDKIRYKSFIVCSTNEEDARKAASVKINAMQIYTTSEPTKLLDPVYSDKSLSQCILLDVKIKKIHTTYHFSYNGFNYILPQDFASPLKINDDTD